MSARVVFVVNPAAGHGRGAARWRRVAALARELFAAPDVLMTEGPGAARALAAAAVAGGAELVVAVGGDGTLGEVVDGYLSVPARGRAGASIAVYPAGSGCDFARHVGVPAEPEAWARLLRSGRRRRLDAGRASFRGPDGAPRARHFLNVAAAGLAGDVAAGAARRGKPLGGALTYFLESALAALTAPPRRLRLVVDGVEEAPALYHLVAAANTSTFGGGMKIAPGADATDGLLDLVTVAALPRARLLALLPRVYRGGHVGEPGVRLRRVARVELHADEPLPLNVDGDAEGTLPAVLEALPGAVDFRA